MGSEEDEEIEFEGAGEEELALDLGASGAEATWVISGAGISRIADDPTEDV